MAAACRNAILKCLSRRTKFLAPSTAQSVIRRGQKQWHSKYYAELYRRRLEVGPDKERPKSAWLNWNYDAEVFAFGKRLGEDFEEQTLKTAFTDESYIEKELERRRELEVEDVALNLECNSELYQSGKDLAETHVKRFLRFSFPYLPEEGISTFSDFLMSEKTLGHIAYNIGIKDLILSDEFPVPSELVIKSFLAVVGGLAKDQGEDRAKTFVQDFILTQLIGEDLRELWEIINPMGVLTDLLKKQNRGLPEPRLIGEAGGNSIMGCFVVGIYSDRELIGEAPGETVTIAEEMAAKDALVNIYELTDYRGPLKFKIPPSIIDSYEKGKLGEARRKQISS